MSNIYLKVTIEKNLCSQNFDFLISKNFKNFLLQLKNQRSGSKTVCVFSIILIFKGIMSFLKSKSPYILLDKNIKFNKNETE